MAVLGFILNFIEEIFGSMNKIVFIITFLSAFVFISLTILLFDLILFFKGKETILFKFKFSNLEKCSFFVFFVFLAFLIYYFFSIGSNESKGWFLILFLFFLGPIFILILPLFIFLKNKLKGLAYLGIILLISFFIGIIAGSYIGRVELENFEKSNQIYQTQNSNNLNSIDLNSSVYQNRYKEIKYDEKLSESEKNKLINKLKTESYKNGTKVNDVINKEIENFISNTGTGARLRLLGKDGLTVKGIRRTIGNDEEISLSDTKEILQIYYDELKKR